MLVFREPVTAIDSCFVPVTDSVFFFEHFLKPVTDSVFVPDSLAIVFDDIILSRYLFIYLPQ